MKYDEKIVAGFVGEIATTVARAIITRELTPLSCIWSIEDEELVAMSIFSEPCICYGKIEQDDLEVDMLELISALGIPRLGGLTSYTGTVHVDMEWYDSDLTYDILLHLDDETNVPPLWECVAGVYRRRQDVVLDPNRFEIDLKEPRA